MYTITIKDYLYGAPTRCPSIIFRATSLPKQNANKETRLSKQYLPLPPSEFMNLAMKRGSKKAKRREVE
jgi:hypothetical protein